MSNKALSNLCIHLNLCHLSPRLCKVIPQKKKLTVLAPLPRKFPHTADPIIKFWPFKLNYHKLFFGLFYSEPINLNNWTKTDLTSSTFFFLLLPVMERSPTDVTFFDEREKATEDSGEFCGYITILC
jgi:hypothetical protein